MERSKEIKEALTSYAERLKTVRRLSAPSIEEVKDAEDYSSLLLNNFHEIGALARENADILERLIMPLINGEEQLSEEEAAQLDELNGLLFNEKHEGSVDIHLAEMINDRLDGRVELDEEETDTDTDPEKRIHILDRRIDILYDRFSACYRAGDKEECRKINRLVTADYLEMVHFLEKDIFAKLSEESRKLVWIDARFGACLYEVYEPAEMVRRLKWLMDLQKDPFYREQLPDCDWDENSFICNEYIAEMSYSDTLSEELCREAFEASCICEKLLAEGKSGTFGEMVGPDFVKILVMSCAEKISDPSLFRRLEEAIERYERRDRSDYSRQGTNENLANASLIFRVIEKLRTEMGDKLPERILALQRRIPYDMMYYYSLARAGEMAESVVSNLTNFLDDFREVPGGISFGELFIRLLVAIHPPTYVHSSMVAQLSLCLTRHLLKRQPELFVAFPGCGSTEAVMAAGDRILDHAYHAALYHDLGKLTIIDTIAMYGRRLLDKEYLVLKKHPERGAELAERFDSVREYADVMRGHHLWYNGKGGYPLDFNAADSPYKTIIDIVSVADSLDAATDRVGRSYSNGKTLEAFLVEVKEGAGTRYAPFMAELLSEETVVNDLRYMLQADRSRLYRETFGMLMQMYNRGKAHLKGTVSKSEDAAGTPADIRA
ncbi:MAG: HD domain-containing protein [Lachnospiraceae bacterium]|nr:HD domain-containing protein [Lachnospiraceae bacterium]